MPSVVIDAADGLIEVNGSECVPQSPCPGAVTIADSRSCHLIRHGHSLDCLPGAWPALLHLA